jgi:hypothetical protein
MDVISGFIFLKLIVLIFVVATILSSPSIPRMSFGGVQCPVL